MSPVPGPDYRMRRAELRESIRESEGFSVYDALVRRVDWNDPEPWLSMLRALNDSQRTVVAVAQVHEHAQYNGLAGSLGFHGREIFEMAAVGAARLGNARFEEMIREALGDEPDWDRLEARWHKEADVDIEAFVEENAADFFLDE